MEEENNQLHHRLLQKTTTLSAIAAAAADHKLDITSNSPGILPRLIFLFFVGAISLWANYESSKGFEITIVNEAGINTTAGKRFELFYISNDEISRLILRASQFVEDILYPDGTYLKKQVNHVIIRLSSRNLTSPSEFPGGSTKWVVVNSLEDHKYVIEISPLVMETNDFKEALFLAVQQGMTRVWLYNGDGNAPPNLVNGIVKYISEYAIAKQRLSSDKMTKLSEDFFWEEEDEDAVAEYLNYCEMHIEGFIRRLNQELKDGWRDDLLPKTCKSSS